MRATARWRSRSAASSGPRSFPTSSRLLQSSLPEVRAEAAECDRRKRHRAGKSAPPAKRSLLSPDSVDRQRSSRRAASVEAEPTCPCCDLRNGRRLPYKTAERGPTRARRDPRVTSRRREPSPIAWASPRAWSARGRLHSRIRPPSRRAIAADHDAATARAGPTGPSRDARVRRLALEALTAARRCDRRRVAGRAAMPIPTRRCDGWRCARPDRVEVGRPRDAGKRRQRRSSMVRLEALRALAHARRRAPACECARSADGDRDMHVALRRARPARTLRRIGRASRAASNEPSHDRSERATPRGWHRSRACAGGAGRRGARTSPGRAAAVRRRRKHWQLRLVCRRGPRPSLERSARARGARRDEPDGQGGGQHRADRAWRHQPNRVPCRHDDRPSVALDLERRRAPRLALPRARVTIRDVGSIELALLTIEAPPRSCASRAGGVGLLQRPDVRSRRSQRGRQAGRPTDPDGLAVLIRDEVGTWPHVRGAVGFQRRIPATLSSSSIWSTTRDSIISTRSSPRC